MISFGSPVACIINGAIRFGVILEARAVEDKNGSHEEYLVQPLQFKSDLPEGEAVVLTQEALEDVTYNARAVLDLANSHELTVNAKAGADRIKNGDPKPTEVVQMPVEPPTDLAPDLMSPTKTEDVPF